MNRPVYVVAPSFTLGSGGIVVLHRLAQLLHESGFDVSLVPTHFRGRLDEYTCGFPGVQVASPSDVAPQGVVVYPEIVDGNPLNCEFVVRWLLNRPGVMGGDVKFSEDEHFFIYSTNHYSADEQFLNYPLLAISWLRRDVFYPMNMERPLNVVGWLHKGSKYHPAEVVPDNLFILDNLNDMQRAVMLNLSKMLISYDPHSFMTLQAIMCGCMPIIVPKPGVGAEEYFSTAPIKSGVAYGFEDLERAQETFPKAQFELEAYEQVRQKTYEDFAKFLSSL